METSIVSGINGNGYLLGVATMSMDIVKGNGFQRISGNFGEQIVAHWLSRTGWEVILADYIGLDLIAYNIKSKKRIGIYVKARTWARRETQSGVSLFDNKKKGKDLGDKKDRIKFQKACEYFACDEQWIAVYVEREESADLYLTSLANYRREKYCKKGRATDDWKITEKYLTKYANDPKVQHLHICFQG